MTSSVWSSTATKATTTGSLASAASQMRALVADDRFEPRRAELQDIATVLEHPDQPTNGWEHTNLIQAFPPDSTIKITSRRLAERILGVLAAVFVFAPIAWTWFSLSEATTAYQRWIANTETPAAGEGARASFFQLWVEGFDGELASIHYLTNVAAVSVALIAIAVFFIVAHRWVENWLDAREASEYADAEMQLAAALTSAQREIGQSLLSDEKSTESLVRASVRQLSQAHDQTRASAEELRKTTEEFRAAMADTEALMSDWRTATQATVDVTLDAASNLEGLITSTQGVLQSSVAEMSTTAAELRNSIKDVSRGSDAIAAAAAALPQQFSQTVQTTMGGVENNLTSLVQQFGASSVGIGTSTQQVSETVERIGQALSSNSTAVQAQITELTLAREKLQELSAVLASRFNGQGT